MRSLEIKNLELAIAGRKILDGFSLKINAGEIHALVGKNGIGKSSLAKAIARCPGYEILGGDILIDGESVIDKTPDEVALMGFFLAFQNPIEIPGVSVANFIRAAIQSKLPKGSYFNAIEFYKTLHENMEILCIDKNFSSRSLNDGFSGGEKKRFEVLQMLMLNPKYVVFDETDSGLDVDALKIVAAAINSMRGDDFAAMIITHHNKLLKYVQPDFVNIIDEGKIALRGGPKLLDKLDEFGYSFVNQGSGDL